MLCCEKFFHFNESICMRKFTSLAYIKNQPPFELKLRFLLSLKAANTKRGQLLLIQKFLGTRLSITDELSWKHQFLGSIFNKS